jgi:hypothetical protein
MVTRRSRNADANEGKGLGTEVLEDDSGRAGEAIGQVGGASRRTFVVGHLFLETFIGEEMKSTFDVDGRDDAAGGEHGALPVAWWATGAARADACRRLSFRHSSAEPESGCSWYWSWNHRGARPAESRCRTARMPLRIQQLRWNDSRYLRNVKEKDGIPASTT